MSTALIILALIPVSGKMKGNSVRFHITAITGSLDILVKLNNCTCNIHRDNYYNNLHDFRLF